MPVLDKNKNIHCATCNAIIMKTDEGEMMFSILKIKCKCGAMNEIRVKKVYSLEVSVLKNGGKNR